MCVVVCRMNRCARHSLDIDTRDKTYTQAVDGLAESLRNCSFGIGYHPGIENVDNTYDIRHSSVI